MNSMIGKSTGIALLMAAALLAALFAMGVFSATGVSAHDPDEDTLGGHGFTDNEFENVPAHDLLTGLTATASDSDGTAVAPAVALVPDTFDEHGHEYTFAVPDDATSLEVAANGGPNWLAAASVSFMIDGTAVAATDVTRAGFDDAAGDTTDATSTITVDLTDGIVKTITAYASDGTAADANGAGGPGRYTITLNYSAVNTSDTGSGGTAIDLDLEGDGINVNVTAGSEPDVALNDNIVVKLPGFTVPSDLDPEYISVTTSVGSYNPSDVNVSGTTLTLRMGNTGTVATTTPTATAAIQAIFITKRAGIINPAQANDAPDSYPVTIEDASEETAVGHALVLRKVSATPNKGTRGTTTTIKGSGLPQGSSTIRISGADRTNPHNIGVIAAKDGTFSYEIATDAKDNDGANVFSKGANTINVSDARGKLVNVTGTFTVNPSFSIDPESPIPGQIVTVTLSDIDGAVTDASFAGQGIENAFDGPDTDTLPNDAKVKTVTVAGKSTYQIKMPSSVRRGSVEMRITVGTETLKKTVTIATNSLTVDPETAVPGQQITITGSGFTAGGSIAAADIKIDGKVVSTEGESVDSTGNINFTVNVKEVGDSPRTIKSGSRNVEVTDSSGRVGTAKITVPAAAITLSPAEGLIGSTITVSGTGFPANDLVLISYGGTTISTANTDPTGNFSRDVTVPSSAEVGDEAPVKAESQVIEGVSDSADHATPSPALGSATSTSAQAGGTVTIAGINFKGFVRVSSIKVGGTIVTPVPAPSTDQWGAFTATGVQVPNLTLGTHPVEITVDEKTVTGFISITAAPVSQAPADVFAEIGDRLLRVWHLDRATQHWTFYDPDAEVFALVPDDRKLTSVSSGQVVTIIISEGDPVDFQGMQLYQGSNPISLR